MKFINYFFIFLIICLFFSCSESTLTDSANNSNNEESNEVNTSEELSSLLNEYSNIESMELSKTPSVENCNYNNIEIVQEFYNYFLTGNIEGLLSLLADDLVWTHLGPENPSLPFYSTFYGKNGFLEWLTALSQNATMNAFDIRYMISSDNYVNTHVLEGAIMLESGSQVYIENFHSIRINQYGKINSVLVIAESDTVLESLDGMPGEIFETEYKTSDYTAELNISDRIKKGIAIVATYLIKTGNYNVLKKLISHDIEIATSGYEISVPFFGLFTGKKEAKDFIREFSKESHCLNISKIVASGNKVNIHFFLNGTSSKTKEEYSTIGIFAFQFNEIGKIARLYFYSNTGEITEAYR